MKYLTALLLTISVTCQADSEVWVFGDSLSSGKDSWPAAIMQIDTDPDTDGVQPATHMRIAAQGGLSYANQDNEIVFSIPEWLACEGGAQMAEIKVVIWLGSNDGIFGTHNGALTQAVNNALTTLTEKNCEIYLALPPEREVQMPDYQEWVTKRSIITQVAEQHGVIPIEVPYNWAWTTDGLHPNEFQSWLLANFWIRELNL